MFLYYYLEHVLKGKAAICSKKNIQQSIFFNAILV